MLMVLEFILCILKSIMCVILDFLILAMLLSETSYSTKLMLKHQPNNTAIDILG